jgi:hypothetical protein
VEEEANEERRKRKKKEEEEDDEWEHDYSRRRTFVKYIAMLRLTTSCTI